MEHVTVRLPLEVANAKFGNTKLITLIKRMGGEVVETSQTCQEPDQKNDASEVFDYWIEILGPHFKRTPKKLDKRMTIIRSRLRKWSVQDLKDVIDYVSKSSFHLGNNDAGKKYVDLDHIMGNDLKVERKLEMKSSQNADSSESDRLTLVTLGERIRTGTASLDDKTAFTLLNHKIVEREGRRFNWQTSEFQMVR